MKTFYVTVLLTETTWHIYGYKAKEIAIGTHGVQLLGEDNSTLVFIPFDKLIDIAESTGISKASRQ